MPTLEPTSGFPTNCSSLGGCAVNSFMPLPILLLTCWPSVTTSPAFRGMTDSGTACVFPCLPLCYSLYTSSRPTNQCYIIFSAPILLPRPVSSPHVRVCPRFESFPSQHSLDRSSHTPSFHSSHLLWLPISSNETNLACFRSIFFTSCRQTTLMSTATGPSNNKVRHCGHLMPRSRVSHMNAPASPLTCLHVCTSKSCFLHAFCCSFFIFPSRHLHLRRALLWWIVPSQPPKIFTSMKSDKETDSFLPAAAAICLLFCSLSVGAKPTACPLHALAGDQSRPQQLPHTSPHVNFLKDPIFRNKRGSHITLLPSRLLFCSQLLRSCPQVHSIGFNAGCKAHSIPSAAFLKLLFQTVARRNHLDFLPLSLLPCLTAYISSYRRQNLLRKTCQLISPLAIGCRSRKPST